MLHFNSSKNSSSQYNKITEKSNLYDSEKILSIYHFDKKHGGRTLINGDDELNISKVKESYPYLSYDKQSRSFTVKLDSYNTVVFSYLDIITYIINQFIYKTSPNDEFIKSNIGGIFKINSYYNIVIKNHDESPIMGDLNMLIILNNDLKMYETTKLETEISQLNDNIKLNVKYYILLFIYELLNYSLKQLAYISDIIKDNPKKQTLAKYILRYTVANTFRIYNFTNNQSILFIDKLNSLESMVDKSDKIKNIIGGKTDQILKHISHNNSCMQKIAANNRIYTLVGGDEDSNEDSNDEIYDDVSSEDTTSDTSSEDSGDHIDDSNSQ